MSSAAADFMTALADRYRIERELGRGGMATVYLAHDLRHDRPVALKVLHPDLAHALGPERFLREIKTIARLQHPHILTVLDSGDTVGQLWFTMPFVDGESLRDRLTHERQMAVDESLRIATEVGRALEHAHRAGVIHRDIKPENILLTKEGDTLVADFGIARVLSGGEQQLTETGMAVGTPAYMSPEQASGERGLDARTDVYALGSVLYEMLAGEAPFTGATAQAVIAKRMRGTVPQVREIRPNVPVAIEAAISRALAPVPADRFASAADFVRALAVSSTSVATPATKRRVPAGLVLLLTGFLVGAGFLFAWKRGSAPVVHGPRVIAVLPFDNQGDSSQEYFADGITDEIRGKLTVLPGVQVIAGNSSNAYRGTDKPLKQVASELGADYLLMAKVRWASGENGKRQVQVSPELVGLSTGKPTTQWQQAFSASITDVFQVQSTIAGQVAQALGVVLADSVSQKLAARPTENIQAYEAFLHGEQIFVTQAANDPTNLRRAMSYYQQALSLDSTFALAWARLSRANDFLFVNTVPDPVLSDNALKAAERAIALDPTRVDGYLALGGHYRDVADDPVKASTAIQTAFRLAPRDASVLTSIGSLDALLGQWDSALVHHEAAAKLDPRGVLPSLRYGSALRRVGRLSEARAELDRGLAIAPGSLALRQARVMVELRAGKLDSARAVLRAGAGQVDEAALVSYMGNFWDLGWALDDAQQRLLLTLRPDAYGGERSTWAVVMAQTYWFRGDREHARMYADSARGPLQEVLKLAPTDEQLQLFASWMDAYAGRREDALRRAEQLEVMKPKTQAFAFRKYYKLLLAKVYVLTGESDKAVAVLEDVLSQPDDISREWLRIDPNFTPLKGNPRFEKLIAGK